MRLNLLRNKQSIGSAIGLLTIAMVLTAMLGTAGCGLAGAPGSGGSSGGSGAPSGGPAPSSQLSASSTSVTFGNVTVGTSAAQLVTLTDVGTANVSISTVSATGSGFSAGGGSNVTLTPNQSVTISVNFDPTAPGSAQGSVSIASNASNSVSKIGMSGVGVAEVVVHRVALNWQASPSQVIGYFVYRGPTASDLSRLNSSAEPSTSYTDTSVAGGQTYFYAVTSIDSSNVESAQSNQVSVTIPSQ